MTLDGLGLHLLHEFNPVFLSLIPRFPAQVLSPFLNGVHKFRLEQVVIVLQLEALMEQSSVDLVSEAHETDGLVSDLRDQCPVLVVLRSDQLGEEVLSVCFGDGFRLVVEDVGQVVVILLLGSPNFDEGHQLHSRGEEYLGAAIDATDVRHGLSIFAVHFLEHVAEWIEAVVDVVVASVALWWKLMVRQRVKNE